MPGSPAPNCRTGRVDTFPTRREIGEVDVVLDVTATPFGSLVAPPFMTAMLSSSNSHRADAVTRVRGQFGAVRSSKAHSATFASRNTNGSSVKALCHLLVPRRTRHAKIYAFTKQPRSPALPDVAYHVDGSRRTYKAFVRRLGGHRRASGEIAVNAGITPTDQRQSAVVFNTIKPLSTQGG